MDYRLKQQQRTVFPHISKPSLYVSEPRLSNYYSSLNQIHPYSTNRYKSSVFNNNNDDISYDVDNPSSFGYLNAFLLKKQKQEQQQQSIQLPNVKKLIAQFEKPNISRPKSAPLIDQSPSKPMKTILQRPIQNKSSPLRSKSVTFEWENNISSTTDDEKINHPQNSRINIGITLDSRLRKTPVLDMLRSTTMEFDTLEPQRFNRTYSLKNSFIPIARF